MLLWIITLLYVGQVVVSLYHGHNPQALIIGGYVVANLGLIWSMSVQS